MNLTVEQLMAQAIKFLKTDQPNMAALDMKKALELLKKEKAHRGLEKVFAFFAQIRDVFIGAFNAVRDACSQAFAAFSSLAEAFQSDFALAADHE
ncbi:hypothetical protein SAMN04489740_0971 [Arthrobacter alpinus]|uniref:Uncharacterized protein n=1 Tax=Arthrobacter alpinus TaxID=656366 RepID=A0A1H5HBH6_9MICC|nr:hypothetical protein [Arthrobacter alpinus]SEE25114.1 hypothetical protein SAMN04489740_0971 [Arthrobacter alpinus]